MERSLYITKYRNIGYEKCEKLVLNSTLEKDKIGNLIILVGPNNAGKSNVLDALATFDRKKFDSRDITTLGYEENDDNCQLSLCCKDGKDEYTYRISRKDELFIHYPSKELNLNIFADREQLRNEVATFMGYYSSHIYNLRYNNTYNNYEDIILNEEVSKVKDYVISLVKDYLSYDTNLWNSYYQKYNPKLINEVYEIASDDKLAKLNKTYEAKYGYNFMPKIITYVEKQITNNDITTTSPYNNSFFIILFNKINYSMEKLKKVYDAFRTQNNKAILTKAEKDINKKLNTISDDFNKLYHSTKDKYSFKISLESDKVYFEIFRSDEALSLNYQSTGFKWFFNLYFNLLCNNSLSVGDILIMDEPATTLHIKGQQELRKFLKTFAINNGLTIIVATHSPFLVDPKNYDELRVISSNENKSVICNEFTSYDHSDNDCLKPIKEAFTIQPNVFYELNEKVILCEGITDYNYLYAMKDKLEIKDFISFLPINGVGTNKEQQLEISKSILKNWKKDPILLVDSDKAGKSMKKVNSKDSGLTVVELADINPKFTQIESLFSSNDLSKLGLLVDGKMIKSASTSALLKTYINDYDLEQSTLDNFRDLFNYLID